MLKRFMYAAIGVLALAIAFHLGTRAATAQAGGSSFVGVAVSNAGTGTTTVAITSSGDIYARGGAPYCNFQSGQMSWSPDWCGPTWTHMGTVLGQTAVQSSTWGQIKHRAGQ